MKLRSDDLENSRAAHFVGLARHKIQGMTRKVFAEVHC